MTARSIFVAAMALMLVIFSVVSQAPSPGGGIPIVNDRGLTRQGSPPTTGSLPASSAARRATDPSDASVMARAAEQTEEAIALLLQAVASNPHDAESHSHLGHLLAGLGRHREAVSHFEDAIAINPSRSTYHVQLAQALIHLEEWDRGIAEYLVASEIAPTDEVIHRDLGRALHRIGRDESAIDAYHTALSLNPADPSIHLSLGVAYETLRQWDDAVSAYQRYLDLAPAGPQTTAMKWHVIALLENRERAYPGT